MADTPLKIGWIGIGRMGFPMAERLLKAGHKVAIWNRTRAKAEPLAALGAKIADRLADLAACDIVFVMVSTWGDVREVVGQAPRIVASILFSRLWVPRGNSGRARVSAFKPMPVPADLQHLVR